MTRYDRRALGLLLLGLVQMAAALVGLQSVAGLAAATVASPAPKVFSVAGGLETFSTDFFLEWESTEGVTKQLALTPEVYPRLKGPYKRRNVYGAILAFGPVLYTDEKGRPMFDAASRYALCGDAPVLRELGLDPDDVEALRVRFEVRQGSELEDLPTLLEVDCP